MNNLSVAVRVGLWMGLSAICFAALVSVVRYLSDEMDIWVITFWRTLFAGFMFIPWVMKVGLQGLKTKRWGLYISRAVCMVLASAAMFYSVVLMPMAEATALSFTTPLFTTLLAFLVLREHVGWRRWGSILAGFAGVLVMLRPGIEVFNPAVGWVFLSAVTFALVVIIAKLLAATETPELIVFYLTVLAIPLALIPALAFWQWPNLIQIGWLVVLGALSILNMYAISRALQIGDASLTQPFDFLRLPFTALLGFVFFAQIPNMWTWLGAAIIFTSAVYITQRER